MSAPEVRIREQLRLPLERPVADAAFVVSDSNAEAVRTLAAWPDGAGSVMAGKMAMRWC